MELNTEKKGSTLVVAVTGRLDAVTAPDFESRFGELVDNGETALLVDLAGLDYISSAGLRSILSTAKKLKAVGGSIGFCRLEGMVREVFSVSGFASMFPVHATVDEGIGG